MNEQSCTELAQRAVDALGYELVGCQYETRGRSLLIRIFIDNEKGVSVDDCAKVSRQMSRLLEVEAILGERSYTLEVSSPGLERPLFTLAHFKRFIGSKVNITLQIPENGRNHFKGLIKEVTADEKVVVVVEGQEYQFPFTRIKKACLVPDFL